MKIIMAVLWWIDNKINHNFIEELVYKFDPDGESLYAKLCFEFCQLCGKIDMKMEEHESNKK